MACPFNFEKRNLLTLLSEPEGPSNSINKLLESQFTANYFHRLLSLKFSLWLQFSPLWTLTQRQVTLEMTFSFSLVLLQKDFISRAQEKGDTPTRSVTTDMKLNWKVGAIIKHGIYVVWHWNIMSISFHFKKQKKVCLHDTSMIRFTKY